MSTPSEDRTLVVLAAGIGRRYGGAKQLEGLGPQGELLVEYTLYEAQAAGFERAVLVVRPEAEAAFRERLAPAARQVEIAYAHQAEPRGTGHAVWCAREQVSGAFAVANADDVYGPGSWRALAAARGEGTWSMVAFELARTLSPHGPVSRALVRTAGDRLQGLEEVLEVSEGNAPVSMNLWGLDARVFEVLEEMVARPGKGEAFLPEAIGWAVAAGRVAVRVARTPDRWLGVTWPEDRAWVQEQLRARVAAGVYPAPLWSTA